MSGLKTSTGVELERNSMTRAMDKAAERYGLIMNAFVATHPDGAREYLLTEGEEPIYAHTQAENIFCHIDMIHLSRTKR